MILSIEQTRSDSCSDKTTLKRKLSGLAAACVALAGSLIATPVSAQDRRVLIFGEVGGASIGHADSLQGRAPIVGGGVAFDLTPRLVIEGDVHGGRVLVILTSAVLWIGGGLDWVAGARIGLGYRF